jgi:acetyl esterase/lipase
MMQRETGRPEYREQAERIARFLMNHPRLPADKIPYWDFDAPGIPDAPRDASAGAIMASALIELSQVVETAFGAQCLEMARQQLEALSSPAYLAAPGENGGFLLRHSVGHMPKQSEVDVPLVYADYYYLEALLRYRAWAEAAGLTATHDTSSARTSGEASRKGPPASDRGSSAQAVEATPHFLPGSEAFVFRTVDEGALRLFVVKPEGWSEADRRPCLVSFFGGGWSSGTPTRSIGWAKWAADKGLVGVAPDYRTRKRWGGTPEHCVSDGRAAVRWLQAHATELGIDPGSVVALGSSAGGHVAAWTAISSPGPLAGEPAPDLAPAALVLVNPVTDTSELGYGGLKRFGNDPARALACSVLHQMPADMPPTIVFHGTADATVPYANSVAFRDRMVRDGNRCELVTFEGLGHSFYASRFGKTGQEAKQEMQEAAAAFLESLGLLTPAEVEASR